MFDQTTVFKADAALIQANAFASIAASLALLVGLIERAASEQVRS